MITTRIGLNLSKPSNSSFFCPVNRVHLTKASPIGVIHKVTPQVLLELRSTPMPGIFDLDGKIDLETGKFRADAESNPAPVDNQEDTGDIVNTVDLSGQAASNGEGDKTGEQQTAEQQTAEQQTGNEQGEGVQNVEGGAQEGTESTEGAEKTEGAAEGANAGTEGTEDDSTKTAAKTGSKGGNKAKNQ